MGEGVGAGKKERGKERRLAGGQRGASAKTRTPRECVWPSGSKAARSPGRLRCPRRLAFFCRLAFLALFPRTLRSRPISPPPTVATRRRRHSSLLCQDLSLRTRPGRPPSCVRPPRSTTPTSTQPNAVRTGRPALAHIARLEGGSLSQCSPSHRSQHFRLRDGNGLSHLTAHA